MIMPRLCTSLLVLALCVGGPALAASATAGLGADESRNMPTGRIPVRPDENKAPAPAAPFRLSAPLPPEVNEAGVFKPQTFTLGNGLAVVVIPNPRAPIISHMVWYQVGAADEPAGKSGLAHLLEHLMFKGTPEVPDGVFSRTIAANGGNENAFTSWDYTVFFQNIARDRLEMVMKMEADRMNNLTLADAQVNSERKVVAAERQQTTENSPQARLQEAMRAALFVNHPYGRPIIGWEGELKKLDRDDVLAYYRTWYSPANAVVVIAGDVTAADVKPLAEATYGQLAARQVPARVRLAEPKLDVERRLVLRDANVTQPLLMRSYLAPSYRAGAREQVIPLQVLGEILGGGPTSRLYRRLVLDLRVATSVNFDYDPEALDWSTADVGIAPAPGRDLGLTEVALDAVIKDLLQNGITEAELDRAKKRLIDGAVFARDSVQAPAYLFGMTLATGGDISDVEEWPKRVLAVKSEDVMAAARALFGQKGTVTGLLQSEAGSTASAASPSARPVSARPEGVH